MAGEGFMLPHAVQAVVLVVLELRADRLYIKNCNDARAHSNAHIYICIYDPSLLLRVRPPFLFHNVCQELPPGRSRAV